MTEKKAKADNHIDAPVRESFGKGAARRLRMQGLIPAVIYGHGTPVLHVSLPAHEIGLRLRKANAILELSVDGKSTLALVKDVQKDPVRQIIEHLDLVIVRKGEKVQVEVPIHLDGESFPGTIAMLEVNSIRLEAEATHIPERIIIDIEGAEEGTQIHASAVTLPAGSTLLDDPELLLVNIVVPAAPVLDEPTVSEDEDVEGEEGDEAAEGESDGESGDSAE